MFKTLTDMPEQIEIYLDGRPVQVPAGIPVAAAMLLLDALPTRPYSSSSIGHRAATRQSFPD
jgi:hypothetical protein